MKKIEINQVEHFEAGHPCYYIGLMFAPAVAGGPLTLSFWFGLAALNGCLDFEYTGAGN